MPTRIMKADEIIWVEMNTDKGSNSLLSKCLRNRDVSKNDRAVRKVIIIGTYFGI